MKTKKKVEKRKRTADHLMPLGLLFTGPFFVGDGNLVTNLQPAIKINKVYLYIVYIIKQQFQRQCQCQQQHQQQQTLSFNHGCCN